MILHKQKLAILGGLLLVLCIFAIFRTDANTVALEVRTVKEKSSIYDISVSYPQFSGVKKSFNTEIKTTVETALANFKKASGETEEVRKAPEGKGMPEYVYTFFASWSPDQISPERISFVLHTSYFTGGAHGGQELYTFNYDLKQKKIITLEDVFGTVPNYLHRISEFVVSDLRAQLQANGNGGKIDETMLISGTAPTQDNYQHFTLGAEGTISFYFPQYQVAPYAYGEQKVIMPLSYIIAN